MNVKDVIIKDNSLLTLINKNLSISETYGDDLWLNFNSISGLLLITII